MTTETKYTPGPWELMEDRAPGGLELGANGRAICEIWRRNKPDTEEANAHLIAASPDMYAALEGAREYVAILLAERNRAYAGFAAITDVPDIEACLAQIDATLAKAEGKA